MSHRAVIHPFGTAPQVVPAGYTLATEVHGTDDEVGRLFAYQDVVLVRGAAVRGQDGVHSVGVFVPKKDAAEAGQGKQVWYVDGGPVAATVCTKLLGAVFTCKPVPGTDFFAFEMSKADSVRLRPPIARDVPSYAG